MKFANYNFFARGVNNLGDNMQIIAIDELYESMGIKKEQIVYINTNDLDTYSGEYVILPVTMPLVDYRKGGISGRFSDRIIPVFLGLTMVKDTLETEEIAYLNKFSPIGCRDERTLNTLRRYGISSYLHGCITATLPLRDIKKSYNKVFIVDAPDSIKKHIPKDIMEKAEHMTHMHENISGDPKNLMEEYYNKYKNEACLVVTSLLHCSMPCIAAGIPVILVKDAEAISYRFSWLEKITKIYTRSEFKNINWNQQPILYEEHKKRVKELTIKRLKNAFDKYSDMMDISYYYEERERKKYINDACKSLIEYIDSNWTDDKKDYNYSIWGMTQIGEYMHSYISRIYPNAKLCHVYDTYRDEIFCGIKSTHPSKIFDFPNETVLIATNGAVQAAKEMELDKRNIQYAYVVVMK